MPRRAVPSCFGGTPTGCSVHSALQGRRGLTSPQQRLIRGPIGAQDRCNPPPYPTSLPSLPPSLPPSHHPEGRKHLGRIGARQRRMEEDERRLTRCMKMSPERRDLVPGETINSSLQWLCEGAAGQQGSLWMGRNSGRKTKPRTLSLFFLLLLPTGALAFPDVHQKFP